MASSRRASASGASSVPTDTSSPSARPNIIGFPVPPVTLIEDPRGAAQTIQHLCNGPERIAGGIGQAQLQFDPNHLARLSLPDRDAMDGSQTDGRQALFQRIGK